MIDYLSVGKRIKSIRRACGATQKEIAAGLKLSAGYINRLERGKAKTELEILNKIANYFRCDMSWILWGSVRE